ncbi:DUF2461 domain-containing protein [Phaeocystidibacter luteus]|uniref:DUF2461 domain-containing protein n=1 Tax=Phaeocystidibacter luteus TaxID=911197 RepID=A0A6N6RII0_9FLAO|nr:DUF2461 domain-containing protein [Phaeocystidibacter luteus]KAB2810173.1 DUF2461 domain-containing protein [Phaeocystidibacter luteus]
MNYFSPDFLEFFKELAANNHKDWFDENRKRYEKEVKEPFKIFVGDIIGQLRASHEPNLLIEPKDAIFRINRDIRFSKDKAPYKTNVSALISAKGRKSPDYPALYIELSPEKLGIYGGAYMLKPVQVKQLREHMAANLSAFQKLNSDSNFRKHFPEGIVGQAQKRVDKAVAEAAEKEPILFQKQFYYHHDVPPEIIPTDGLFITVMDHYEASKDLMHFLREGLGM